MYSVRLVDPLLGAYITVTSILVVTPGSTTAVVVRSALWGGRASGLAAAGGAALANSTHATAAGLGLAVVFARWPMALAALRVAGAAYLAWLGIDSLVRGLRHTDRGMARLSSAAPHDRAMHRASFRQGLTANLLNPAIATFYLVVVPTFIPANAGATRFIVLAAIHVALALACHSVWAIALDTLRHVFEPPLARRLLGTATGVALLALAVRVLT
jgi:threonine/homoserine/homoserine lactone efflux protein